jgi:hypothetical protein
MNEYFLNSLQYVYTDYLACDHAKRLCNIWYLSAPNVEKANACLTQ